MSILFKWLGEHNDSFIEISEEEFLKLNPAITKLYQKSGIFLDPYSDTRLSPEHAKILLSEISHKGLRSMIKKSVSESRWILVVGN